MGFNIGKFLFQIFAVIAIIAATYFGGPFGGMVASTILGVVGSLLFPPSGKSDNPKPSGFQMSSSNYGSTIPYLRGMRKLSGNILWWGNFTANEQKQDVDSGMSFGGGQSISTGYTYTVGVAIGVCWGPATVKNMWYGKELYSVASTGIVDGVIEGTLQYYGSEVSENGNTTYATTDAQGNDLTPTDANLTGQKIRIYTGEHTAGDEYVGKYAKRGKAPVYKQLCYVVLPDTALGRSPYLRNIEFEAVSLNRQVLVEAKMGDTLVFSQTKRLLYALNYVSPSPYHYVLTAREVGTFKLYKEVNTQVNGWDNGNIVEEQWLALDWTEEFLFAGLGFSPLWDAPAGAPVGTIIKYNPKTLDEIGRVQYGNAQVQGLITHKCVTQAPNYIYFGTTKGYIGRITVSSFEIEMGRPYCYSLWLLPPALWENFSKSNLDGEPRDGVWSHTSMFSESDDRLAAKGLPPLTPWTWDHGISDIAWNEVKKELAFCTMSQEGWVDVCPTYGTAYWGMVGFLRPTASGFQVKSYRAEPEYLYNPETNQMEVAPSLPTYWNGEQIYIEPGSFNLMMDPQVPYYNDTSPEDRSLLPHGAGKKSPKANCIMWFNPIWQSTYDGIIASSPTGQFYRTASDHPFDSAAIPVDNGAPPMRGFCAGSVGACNIILLDQIFQPTGLVNRNMPYPGFYSPRDSSGSSDPNNPELYLAAAGWGLYTDSVLRVSVNGGTGNQRDWPNPPGGNLVSNYHPIGGIIDPRTNQLIMAEQSFNRLNAVDATSFYDIDRSWIEETDGVYPPDVTQQILTDDRYGLDWDLLKLDLIAFDRTKSWCKQEDLKVSVLFQSQQSVLDVLQYVLNHHNGFITYMDGRIAHRQMMVEIPSGEWSWDDHLVKKSRQSSYTMTADADRNLFNQVALEYTKGKSHHIIGTIIDGDYSDQDVHKKNDLNLKLDALCTIERAGFMANLRLRLALWGGLTVSCKLGPKSLDTLVGNVYLLTAECMEYIKKPVRVVNLTENEDFTMDVVLKEEPPFFNYVDLKVGEADNGKTLARSLGAFVPVSSDDGSSVEIPSDLGQYPHSVIRPMAMEIPPQLITSGIPKIGVTYSRPIQLAWRGASLYKSYGESGFAKVAYSTKTGYTGRVDAVNMVNGKAAIDVLMDYDFAFTSLSSVSELFSIPGNNTIVFRHHNLASTEYRHTFCRYATVTMIGSNKYRLSDLLYDIVGTPLFNTYGAVAVDNEVSVGAAAPIMLDVVSGDSAKLLYFETPSYNSMGSEQSLNDVEPISLQMKNLYNSPCPVYGVTVNGRSV